MSKAFLITYDLNSPGQRYDQVISTIKDDLSTGAWCSYWKSSFLIRSRLTPNQMLERLKPYIDSGDRFLIIEVTKNYQGWLKESNWDYIRNNIFKDNN